MKEGNKHPAVLLIGWMFSNVENNVRMIAVAIWKKFLLNAAAN